MKKKLLNILLYLLLTTILTAQATWNVIIKENDFNLFGNYKEMIQTNDGGFIILLEDFNESGPFPKLQHQMLKYNNQGELLWEKIYDFGVTEPAIIGLSGAQPGENIHELTNGDLVMDGRYQNGDSSFCYFFKIAPSGDSLLLKEIPCIYESDMYNDKLYGLALESNENKLVEINIDGNVTDEIFLQTNAYLEEMILDGQRVYTSRSSQETIYRSFDLVGNYIDSLFFSSEYGRKLIRNDIGGITGYAEGLIKLDNNLEVVWHSTLEELFVDLAPGSDYDGFDVEPTSDGGYILAGNVRFFSNGTNWVYLVKVDHNGVREWGGVYSPSYINLNYIYDIEPVSDGYIFTGSQEEEGRLWLVKVNEEGLLTSTKDIAEKSDLLVYPNPVNEVVNIRWTAKWSGRFKLYNSLGILIEEIPVQNKKEIHYLTGHLSAGYYFFLVENERRGQVTSGRFLKS